MNSIIKDGQQEEEDYYGYSHKRSLSISGNRIVYKVLSYIILEAGVITYIVVLFYVLIVLRLIASIILLIGTKKVS